MPTWPTIIIALALAVSACDNSEEPAGETTSTSTVGEVQTSTSGFDTTTSTTEPSTGTSPSSTTQEASTTASTTDGETTTSGGDTSGSDGDTRCRITTSTGAYDGPCVFALDGPNGSFTVQLADDSPIVDEVVVLTVSIDGEGVAEVRGLTSDGINSRWGTAERSGAEPACWIGIDFEVCAF